MRNSAFASVNDVRAAVIADVAADVASLLASGTQLTTDSGVREVHPGDIAILVSANRTIEPLQNALGGHGIGSVVGTGTSVFATMSAGTGCGCCGRSSRPHETTGWRWLR